MNNKTHIHFLLAILLAIVPLSVLGQSETASVLGTVRDPSGAVVSGASVTLTNRGTSITATSTTDSNGNYLFNNVRIGDYQISVNATGFNRTVAENINLSINARQRVDITLEVESASETVIVSGAAALLETDTSELGQVVQRQQIVALPLNGRSYANLALLTPGVRESHTNTPVGGGREAAFNVNGLRATFNNFLLDGVDNNAYGTSNQSFSSQVIQLSPDAVAEFKVQTNTYSAEFGRAGGAVINATYRSGTNKFNGSLWEFHRNTALNAVGFFKPAGGKPSLIRNQFGFTFGGRIIRDKTFFFTDYEGFRQVQKSLSFSTLPTLAHRQGIFAIDVRNPLTGVVYPAGTPVEMTAFARRVLDELPLPTSSNATGSNYQELVPNNNFQNKYNFRIDHRLNDKLNIFGRWSYRKVEEFAGPTIPGPSGSGGNGLVDVLNKQLTLGGSYILSNASVFDLRFSWSQINAGKRPPLTGGPSMFELYGITGLPDDPMITGGLTTQTISGFSQLGRQATNPQFQNPTTFNIRPSYTFIAGNHNIKVGYEFLHAATQVQDTNPLMGLDTYSAQLSKPVQNLANNNLYNLADFMFGARSQYEFATFTVAEMRQQFHYAYIQDDFRVTRNLTLNLGLRWEFGSPYYEKNNQLSNFDPATNSIVMAKDGSYYDRGLVKPDYNDFGPRLGFAYSLGSKTVFRGGYGMGYFFMNRLGSADILGTNFPIITRAAVQQNTRIGLPVCVGNVYTDDCFRPTQAGYPTSGLPNNVVLYIPHDRPTASIQNWQLSIQREVMKDLVVSIAYVGNKAKDTVLLADFNQARTLTEAEAALPVAQQPSLDARRPIQGFGSISAVIPEGFSDYNALQIKAERRFNRGLYFLNSFTWSKAMDNGSQVLEEANGNAGNPQNIHNIAADKGIGAYDQPFNNTTTIVWDMPIGRGRWIGRDMNAVLDAFVGGWQLNGINTMTSGAPISFRYGPSNVTNNLPSFMGGVALRPNLNCDPINRGDRPDPTTNYFIRECLSQPTAWSPFGNVGRNTARSDSYYNVDFSLQKHFRMPINEESRLQIRAEFFNLFNTTNFNAANSDINSGNFGRITSAKPARQIQLGVKFSF